MKKYPCGVHYKKIAIYGAGKVGLDIARAAIKKGSQATLFNNNAAHVSKLKTKNLKPLDKNNIFYAHLANEYFIDTVLHDHDCIFIASAWHDARQLLEKLAKKSTVPVITIARPLTKDSFLTELNPLHCPIIIGAGLEPGLIEALSAALLEPFKGSVSLSTYCGGLPRVPAGPFGYALAFGQKLPIDPRLVLTVRGREITKIPRFSSVEPIYFKQIGLLEAFDYANDR